MNREDSKKDIKKGYNYTKYIKYSIPAVAITAGIAYYYLNNGQPSISAEIPEEIEYEEPSLKAEQGQPTLKAEQGQPRIPPPPPLPKGGLDAWHEKYLKLKKLGLSNAYNPNMTEDTLYNIIDQKDSKDIIRMLAQFPNPYQFKLQPKRTDLRNIVKWVMED